MPPLVDVFTFLQNQRSLAKQWIWKIILFPELIKIIWCQLICTLLKRKSKRNNRKQCWKQTTRLLIPTICSSRRPSNSYKITSNFKYDKPPIKAKSNIFKNSYITLWIKSITSLKKPALILWTMLYLYFSFVNR